MNHSRYQDKPSEAVLREHLVKRLSGTDAHRGIDFVFRRVPATIRGICPKDLQHSLWDLLEHMRIAQWDILGFSRNPEHRSPEWPEGYWPSSHAPASKQAWEGSFTALLSDLEEMMNLVKDPAVDLFEVFPWGEGQTLLREALLLADHNAYHLGQAVNLRRILGAWPPERT